MNSAMRKAIRGSTDSAIESTAAKKKAPAKNQAPAMNASVAFAGS